MGREGTLAELGRSLERNRLITLIGPGGVGKTRLAQEIGLACAGQVADGVWWIALASARSVHDVTAAVQRALGIDGGSASEPFAELDPVVEVLSNREALLIFDNCEQVVGDVRQVVGELLGRCRDVRVIATSREALELASEHVFAVAPLPTDAAGVLFESRVPAGVDLTGDSGTTVREI